MSPVIKEIRKYPEWFDVNVVVTGQHKEQLFQVLNHFDIQPDIDLNLMAENQTLSSFTSLAINELDNVLNEKKPDLVLVHGDTQTTLCGAFVAFLHRVPIGHVEAGLRSYKKYSPWPEEINRKMVDVVTDLLFTPTMNNRENLLAEGYQPEQIFVTGQTAIDAAILTYQQDHTFEDPFFNRFDFKRKKMITVTFHRRENYGSPIKNIFLSIRKIVENHPNVTIVFPVHLNPRVREYIDEILAGHCRIILLDPLAYPDMINLLARSDLIITDSGGLQEEAVLFQKPLIITRDSTERPEAIADGVGYLAGTDQKKIYNLTKGVLTGPNTFNKTINYDKNPFGDGNASKRIVSVITHYFDFTSELPIEFSDKNLIMDL
ncbi:UDP-N-acetylglucosamine 2-epimerase (non-hydrolyzing) [Alkalihalobacillus sp. AL-G]|nr:UDP-N-acetylglucosamine 2-epimerase (non-hydrolyzing) [Alkalihalobacillus sp. AL-G]